MNTDLPKEASDQLDLELCRAMFDKDADRLIELMSEWLEVHELKTSARFRVPEYLHSILFSKDRYKIN